LDVIVTGAGGFIGKFLVEGLIERGGYRVIALGRGPSPFSDHSGITYYQVDITHTLALNRIFNKHRPQAVFHLAALLADTCEEDPVMATNVNIVATQALLELSTHYGVDRFIYMSSISVYPPDAPEPVREEYAGRPRYFYGITKYAGELIGLWYAEKGYIDFRALRPTVVFGPGRYKGPSAEYSSRIIEGALKGETIVIRDPEAPVNYIYVRDVVEALIRLLEVEKASSRVYNAGGFVSKILDFALLVKKYIPNLRYEIRPSPIFRYPAVIDMTRARSELGWTPKYLYERAIEDYLETYKRGSKIFKI